MPKKKKAKIIALTNAHLGTGEPCIDVVELLQDYLDRAKRGEVIGIAVALVEANNALCCNYASGFADSNLFMAAVHMMHTEITQVWHNDKENISRNK